MQYAKYLLVFPGLAFASAGHAQIHFHECIACTDAEYEHKAITLDTGIHYLYDFGGNEFRRYQVQRVKLELPESTGAPPMFELQAIRQPVPAKMQRTFDARRNVWLLVRETTAIVPLAEVKRTIALDSADDDVPERLGVSSALDIVKIEARQFILEKYICSQLLEIAKMPDGTPASAASSVSTIELDTDVKQLVIAVEMPAGGTVAVRYDANSDADSLDKFAYVEGSARDAAGNRIPEPGQTDQVPGTYTFDNAEQFQSLGKYLSVLMPKVSWPDAFCPAVRCVSPGQDPAIGRLSDQWTPDDGIKCACMAKSS